MSKKGNIMTNSEKLDKIMVDIAEIVPMVKDHHNTLYGNGQPGLAKQVTILEQTQKNCSARKNTNRFNYMALLRTIGVIVAVISAIIAVIKST